jgi:hypothetical protein
LVIAFVPESLVRANSLDAVVKSHRSQEEEIVQ